VYFGRHDVGSLQGSVERCVAPSSCQSVHSFLDTSVCLILSQASCAYQTDTETRKPETYPFKLFYSDLLAMKADAIQVKRARESGVDHGAVEARVSLRRWLWYLLMWHRESFTLTKPIRLQNPLARGYVSDSPPARPPVAASTTPLRA
jgi:hypothetical protein